MSIKGGSAMKKLLVVVLVLVFTLVVAACGGGQTDSQENYPLDITEQDPVQNEQPDPPPYNPPDDHPEIPPPPVDDTPFLTEPITIGAGTLWAIEGYLTIPAEATAENPVPAVIIVHGSGPQNRDGALGIRPYFDIAEYLSANGIAVIRYDKRNYIHAQALDLAFGGRFTIWEEAIEDALLATELARTDARIDADRVFLLGHSLGGAIAPRIHAVGGDFAGLILLAGSPRSLGEVGIDQFETMYYLHDEAERPLVLNALGIEYIGQLREIYDMVYSTPSDEAQNMWFVDVSFYYFQNLRATPFAEFIGDIHVPFLVMQGARDFQVLADVDFAMLGELLAGRDNVTMRLYDDLDHLFMQTTATNFVEHGAVIAQTRGRRVDTQVLRDIVDWVHSIN